MTQDPSQPPFPNASLRNIVALFQEARLNELPKTKWCKRPHQRPEGASTCFTNSATSEDLPLAPVLG